MSLLDQIKSLSQKYSKEVIDYRRHIHANPELSYQEFNTVKYVGEKLRSFGLTDIQSMATTGLVVNIKGKNPDKKTIALRADMDALPISESNDVAYKSKNEGVMHAC